MAGDRIKDICTCVIDIIAHLFLVFMLLVSLGLTVAVLWFYVFPISQLHTAAVHYGAWFYALIGVAVFIPAASALLWTAVLVRILRQSWLDRRSTPV